MPDFEHMTDEELHDYLVEQDDSLYASRMNLREHFEPHLVWVLDALLWITKHVAALVNLLLYKWGK